MSKNESNNEEIKDELDENENDEKIEQESEGNEDLK